MRGAPSIGYHYAGPEGASAQAFPSIEAAADAALRRALASKYDPAWDAETKNKLWRQLKAKGWAVRWEGQEARRP